AGLPVVGEPRKGAALSPRNRERLAVDVEPAAAIKQLGFEVEPYKRCFRRAFPKNHLGLRRRKKPPQKILDVPLLPADLFQQPGRKADHPRVDPRAAPRRRQSWIAVLGIRHAALVQVVEEGGAELRAARRAEADRTREAFIER